MPLSEPFRPGDLWRSPEPLLQDAGAQGELLVARIRLVLVAILFLIPLIGIGPNSEAETLVGLGLTVTALSAAAGVYLALRRDFYRSWLPFLTSGWDVSLVSAGLGLFLLLGLPHIAVNSKVLFEVYFLAIGAASLRYDVRVCLVTGLLAVAEYGGIVWFASTHWALNDPMYAPYVYGRFALSDQIARLVLLVAAAVLSGLVVLRSRRLRRLSTSDRLTGLMNRGYFDERFQAEIVRARRHRHPLSVAMIDVDHFKRFNDTMGHAAGDAALRSLAQAIVHALRRSDIIARYGGEEFVVILPETPRQAAVEKLESMRLAIASLAVQVPRRGVTVNLTVSAGVAALPEDGTEADALLDQADRRLFQAKQGGRNLVVGDTAGRPAPS